MTSDIERIANIVRTESILRRYDFNFKKKFGQNFLTDAHILTKIVETAGLDKNVNVIEIGPGIGSLTQYLLEAAAEVMAFEIDETLMPILSETLAAYDNLQLVNADVLKVDLRDYISRFKNPDLPVKVVANLPYYITTAILTKLVASKLPFVELIVMMQKEVAARISAHPGNKDYGQLTLALQYFYQAEIAFTVPRTVFVPSPNVDSAILKLKRRETPATTVKDEDWLFKLIKISFAHRRKTIMNNLQIALGKDNKDEFLSTLAAAGISPTARAESLTMEDFGKLSDLLLAQKQ